MEAGNPEHTAQPASSSAWGRGDDFFRQLVWSEYLPGSWAGLCLFQTAQMVRLFQVAQLGLGPF